MVAWIAAVALATPGSAALASAWTTDEAQLRLPVALVADDFDVLATGEPVAHRIDTDSGAYAVGAMWIAASPASVWVTLQDTRHRPIMAGANSTWLPGETPTHRDVYMLLDLPWPVSDRQWVGDFRAATAAYDATSGRVWQRRWTVGDPALASAPDPDAIWVETNEGAWTLIAVDGGTLCVLSIRTVLGGAIPTDLAQSWAKGSMKSTMRTLGELAPGTAAHYAAGHVVIYDPDGVALPFGLGG
jgi:hypothetical protein